MSRENKYIECFNKGMREGIQEICPEKAGEKPFEQQTDEEKVLYAFVAVNALSLSENVKNPVNYKRDESGLILEFVNYFLARYGENKKVVKTIEDAYGHFRPRIFVLYDEIFEKEQKDGKLKLFNAIDQLRENASPEDLKDLQSYVDFVHSMRTERHISYSDDNEEGRFMIYPDDRRKETRRFIEGIFLYARKNDGIVIIRQKTEDCDIVSALGGRNGRLQAISKSGLEEAFAESAKERNRTEVYEEFPAQNRRRFRVVRQQ